MRIGATFALLIALCVLFTLLGSTAPVNADPSSAVNGSDTVINIQIRPNGDAAISVVTIVPIRGTNDTAGFERAEQAFELGSIDGNSLDSFRRAATAASNASNRSMSVDVENATRTAIRDGDVGKFILEFTWRNFANRTTTTNGTYLTVHDAFRTPHGTWLPRLTEDQALVIRGPDGYHVHSASVGHNGLSFVLSGPYPFDYLNFNITYHSDRSSRPETQTPDTVDTSIGITEIAALIALVALGSVGVFAFSRRDGLLRRVKADRGVGTDGLEQGGSSLSTTDGSGDRLDPDDTADTDTDSDTDGETLQDDSINFDLLSDEERVERLLAESGGRMKQANIVRETDWSNAKVSQLLSSMDEEGRIEKLRIGRENLISLSGHGEDDQNRS